MVRCKAFEIDEFSPTWGVVEVSRGVSDGGARLARRGHLARLVISLSHTHTLAHSHTLLTFSRASPGLTDYSPGRANVARVRQSRPWLSVTSPYCLKVPPSLGRGRKERSDDSCRGLQVKRLALAFIQILALAFRLKSATLGRGRNEGSNDSSRAGRATRTGRCRADNPSTYCLLLLFDAIS